MSDAFGLDQLIDDLAADIPAGKDEFGTHRRHAIGDTPRIGRGTSVRRASPHHARSSNARRVRTPHMYAGLSSGWSRARPLDCLSCPMCSKVMTRYFRREAPDIIVVFGCEQVFETQNIGKPGLGHVARSVIST